MAIDPTVEKADMRDRWSKDRNLDVPRALTSRLPAIKGAGKITAWVVDRNGRPPGTLRDVELPNGLQMRVDVSQKYERSMFLSPQLYEFRSQQLLRRRLRPGDTFVDVGANVGLFTLLAAQLVGPLGKVVAIEPDPDTFLRLTWSIQANRLGNVIAVPQAVSHIAGQMSLFRDLSGNTGGNSLSAGASASSAPITVSVNTLDAILDDAEVEHVDVMKIDIEGWEVNALRNSRVLRQNPRPFILTEANDRLLKEAGSSLAELEATFERFGFTGQCVGRRDRAYS